MNKKIKILLILIITIVIGILVYNLNFKTNPTILGLRIEFVLFGLTLIGIALFHNYTTKIAVGGFIIISVVKLFYDKDFNFFEHYFGSAHHIGEWHLMLNLFGLLLGFAVLAKHFEDSKVPNLLPKYLPNDWKGPFALLILVAFLSAFLDNIAGAIIGGTIAHVVFKGRVHIGYLASIVAASNAGGAGSVLGDTTTTMMWVDGVSAVDVFHAYYGSVVAIFIFGIFGSIQQDKFQKIIKDAPKKVTIDYKRILVVILILLFAIAGNYYLDFPSAGVWLAIFIGYFLIQIPWEEVKDAVPGTIFLLSLVACASMMPVSELPSASWSSTFILGFISAFFDNIPLTKLALQQGGYDWGILAFAVGFGGSMVWFGSSAGVAISNMYPEAKSFINWIKAGWHIILAYIIAFFFMLWLAGWNPHEPHKKIKNLTTNQQ